MRKKIRIYIVFALAGAVIGYLRFRFIGCPDGTCPLKSSAANSIAYWVLSGLLIAFIYNRL